VPSLPSHTAGARTREVRLRLAMSTRTLSQEMAKAGIRWTQEAVEQFEEGRRDHLDIQELLAIAIVFSVPPIALLVDSTTDTMPLTSEVNVPTAYGLLWLVGEQPLHAMTGSWKKETLMLRLVRKLNEHMWRCLDINTLMLAVERYGADGSIDGNTVKARQVIQERELLESLSDLYHILQQLRGLQIVVPRLIEQETLVELAHRRGIPLGLSTGHPPADEN
jgi:transcriptional regulator with XRE-family HTH domain